MKARHAVKLASLCRSKLFQCVILNTIGSLIRAKCRDELAVMALKTVILVIKVTSVLARGFDYGEFVSRHVRIQIF